MKMKKLLTGLALGTSLVATSFDSNAQRARPNSYMGGNDGTPFMLTVGGVKGFSNNGGAFVELSKDFKDETIFVMNAHVGVQYGGKKLGDASLISQAQKSYYAKSNQVNKAYFGGNFGIQLNAGPVEMNALVNPRLIAFQSNSGVALGAFEASGVASVGLKLWEQFKLNGGIRMPIGVSIFSEKPLTGMFGRSDPDNLSPTQGGFKDTQGFVSLSLSL